MKTNEKTTVLDISCPSKLKSLTKTFKADKVKNSNIIIDLLKKLESKNNAHLKVGLGGIHKIFCLLLKEGDIKYTQNKSSVMTAKDNYDLWIYNRYSDAHTQLLKLLGHTSPHIQEMSLQVSIKLLKNEGEHACSKRYDSFPYERLKSLFATLLHCKLSRNILFKHLQEFMGCDDFLFYVVKSLSTILTEGQYEADAEFQMAILDLLELIDVRESPQKSLSGPKLFVSLGVVKNERSGSTFKKRRKELLKNFNVIWEMVLGWSLTEATCKRCLVLLPEKVLQYLENPVRLTDFFINSYQRGGASALMSLHGVFILISKYNVEYPDFYSKLYTMLEPSVFHTKYRPRFFILLNKFLMSTHLPEYLLGAFIKRLSRLLLTAPSSCLILLLRFITNILLRNPSLRILLHNPDGIDHTNDPYIESEEPSKSMALKSSLWEVSTMLHHSVPSVVGAAKFIYGNLPDMELKIASNVEDSYEEMYILCSKIAQSQTATTFVQPQSLFDDEMSDTWSLF